MDYKKNAKAPVGLILIGAGVSMAIDAGFKKNFKRKGWFLYGSLALALMNAGLSIFGDAIKDSMATSEKAKPGKKPTPKKRVIGK